MFYIIRLELDFLCSSWQNIFFSSIKLIRDLKRSKVNTWQTTLVNPNIIISHATRNKNEIQYFDEKNDILCYATIFNFIISCSKNIKLQARCIELKNIWNGNSKLCRDIFQSNFKNINIYFLIVCKILSYYRLDWTRPPCHNCEHLF